MTHTKHTPRKFIQDGDFYVKPREAIGPCPKCGDWNWWFNDVPLRAFCWGSEEKPHREVVRLVPKPWNLYLED